jgi:hypothetical protein
MIDPTHKLSIARQAKALGIAQSKVYFKPVTCANIGFGPGSIDGGDGSAASRLYVCGREDLA